MYSSELVHVAGYIHADVSVSTCDPDRGGDVRSVKTKAWCVCVPIYTRHLNVVCRELTLHRHLEARLGCQGSVI